MLAAPQPLDAAAPPPARIRPVWARALRELAARTPRAAFATLYPHAWLVAGLRGQQDLPSLTQRVDAEAGVDASSVLQAMRFYADRVELFPLVLRPDAAGPQHFLLGRSSRNDLTLQHTSISKAHAVLTHERGGWTLRDRNSTNGTWAQGLPVRSHQAPVSLRGERALLRFGTVTCALVLRSTDVHDALVHAGG